MTNISYTIVIPARYDSLRLPGKVLEEIAGKPMLQHVWEAAGCSSADQVVIATDDERIRSVVDAFGGKSVITSTQHTSGSDRIAECARILGLSDEALIVNLQGDEPEMPGACLDQVAELLLKNEAADVATLSWPIDRPEEVLDPNVVKVVSDDLGRALYFSRSVIPYPRGHDGITRAIASGTTWHRHLGLYAYRVGALKAFTSQTPGVLEQEEALEQLRFLSMGRMIRVEQARLAIPPGIDTPEDLARARKRFADH